MIGHKGEQAVTVRALRGAAPYIHMYKGRVFVIKTGGGAFRVFSTRPRACRIDGAGSSSFRQIGFFRYGGNKFSFIHFFKSPNASVRENVEIKFR